MFASVLYGDTDIVDENGHFLHHRESLFERYHVMNRHYGYIPTFFMHCWFIIRSVIKK